MNWDGENEKKLRATQCHEVATDYPGVAKDNSKLQRLGLDACTRALNTFISWRQWDKKNNHICIAIKKLKIRELKKKPNYYNDKDHKFASSIQIQGYKRLKFVFSLLIQRLWRNSSGQNFPRENTQKWAFARLYLSRFWGLEAVQWNYYSVWSNKIHLH